MTCGLIWIKRIFVWNCLRWWKWVEYEFDGVIKLEISDLDLKYLRNAIENYCSHANYMDEADFNIFLKNLIFHCLLEKNSNSNLALSFFMTTNVELSKFRLKLEFHDKIFSNQVWQNWSLMVFLDLDANFRTYLFLEV